MLIMFQQVALMQHLHGNAKKLRQAVEEHRQQVADGASNVYNAITGLAASTTNRVAAINVSKAERDAKKVTTYTYTLLTQDEINSENSYVNITIAGLNASNQEIDPKTYNHIPLKIGYTTKLAGVFFDYNNLSFNMTVNKDWGSYETVEL